MDDALKVGFIPFAAPGHMIPLMGIARIFTRQGVEVTYITTPANALRFQEDVDSDSRLGYKIKICALELPCAQVGLPPGLESFSQVTSWDMHMKLQSAHDMLQHPIQQLLHEIRADCIISDTILSWTADAAAQLGIPRLAFNTGGYTTLSILNSVICHAPHEKVESDSQPFIVPGLPHKLEITTSQLPLSVKYYSRSATYRRILETRQNSHGIVLNSFYDLEPDYVKHYEAVSGKKTWALGPVSLWLNKHLPTDGDTSNSGELLQWLDSQQPNSVVYVSFGSMTKFPHAQLLEIAHALEESNHPFIWVVQKQQDNSKEDEEGYLPKGFEERIKQQGRRGLIIRNWAPQILILNHSAIGGFVTHCGWNSTLETICAGQPIIAWPLTSEHFDIEKLVVDILQIAVPVGAKKWWDMNNPSVDLEIVNREQITKAIKVLMSSDEEAKKIRERVKELACAAKRATSSGGSSHTSLVSLIDELKSIKLQRQNN